MTGRDVLTKAMEMMNYTDTDGAVSNNAPSGVMRRGLSLVNQIYSDLWFIENDGVEGVLFSPLTSLSGNLVLTDRAAADVMPYGVAMLLAQSEGDGDNQQLFANLYNRKRTSVNAPVSAIVDMLPTVEE